LKRRASLRGQAAAVQPLGITKDCSEQLTFWDLGTQQAIADFAGGRVVTDAGLLLIRLLDKELRVLAAIAEQLPDPCTICRNVCRVKG
jgi:hypothetical protein